MRCAFFCLTMKTSLSADIEHHSAHMQELLNGVVTHARQDIEKVDDPRFQALLETAAEVAIGLKIAFKHYSEKSEPAWK